MLEKYHRLKKLKIKIIEKRKKWKKKEKQEKIKENSTELQEPSVDAEICNNTKKCD